MAPTRTELNDLNDAELNERMEKVLRQGAKVYIVDGERLTSAQFAIQAWAFLNAVVKALDSGGPDQIDPGRLARARALANADLES